MIIRDVPLMREFSGPGRCEYCGRVCRKRDAHHVFSRGAGRLDIRINLIGLGTVPPDGCGCHHAYHAGKIPRCDLLAVVAAREGLLQSDIEAAIYRLRRTPGEKPARAKKRRPVLPACDRPTCVHCGLVVSGKAYRCPKGTVHGRCLKALFANQRTEG